MKTIPAFILAITILGLTGCDDPKPAPVKKAAEPEGVAALKVPQNVPPPVETQPYDDGFTAGGKAGEADALAKKHRREKHDPTDEEIAVIALEAAGANPDRGAKWQQGFIAGYRYDFERVMKGLR